MRHLAPPPLNMVKLSQSLPRKCVPSGDCESVVFDTAGSRLPNSRSALSTSQSRPASQELISAAAVALDTARNVVRRQGEQGAASRSKIEMRQSMSLLTRPLAATVVIAAWLFSVPAANAQGNAQGQTPSPGPSEQSQNISDQKLDAAAAALEQVASVKENYQGQIEAADPTDRPRLASEAHKALTEAVTGQGLSIEEYTEIITVAQANPEVRQKILQRLRPASK
jgi:hypothetical protein